MLSKNQNRIGTKNIHVHQSRPQNTHFILYPKQMPSLSGCVGIGVLQNCALTIGLIPLHSLCGCNLCSYGSCRYGLYSHGLIAHGEDAAMLVDYDSCCTKVCVPAVGRGGERSYSKWHISYGISVMAY